MWIGGKEEVRTIVANNYHQQNEYYWLKQNDQEVIYYWTKTSFWYIKTARCKIEGNHGNNKIEGKSLKNEAASIKLNVDFGEPMKKQN